MMTISRVPDDRNKIWDGTTEATVTSDGELSVSLDGGVDNSNSTSEPLAIGGVFTGTSVDISDVAAIIVSTYSDVASATDGLCIEYSSDSVNWDFKDCYTISSGSAKTFSNQPTARYMRVTYTNGGTEQSEFRLQTQLKHTYVKPSSHRIQDTIIDDDDAELVMSVTKAKNTNGVFVNINATSSGNLKVANVENGLSIAKGEVVNTSFIHKFGNAPDFDISDGYVTIWDGANDAGIAAMQYTYSTIADIDSISSSNNSDTQNIEIQGLDTNYNLVIQTIALTGQTRKALTTNLIRVFRMKNVGTTDIAGRVFCYVNVSLALGVPSDATKVRSIIQGSNNQTLMAIYTIPSGYVGYMRSWFASTAGSKKTTAHEIHIKARPFGQVFQLKHKSSIIATGASNVVHNYDEPEVFDEKTDIAILANTDVDAVSVSAGFDMVLVAD